MPARLITPSQLSLFSISPVIGAWWEELQAQKLFEGSKPAVSRAQCLSIVAGSPSLASGIAKTMAEAEQINWLCEVFEKRRQIP